MRETERRGQREREREREGGEGKTISFICFNYEIAERRSRNKINAAGLIGAEL
jgi:hypothetical protein